MNDRCCGSDIRFEGLSADYRRRLWAVIALNGTMFAVEMAAGHLAGSQALKADALDFFGDTVTYGLSLAVIGTGLAVRARVAALKGLSLALMGLYVLGVTLWQVFWLDVPAAPVMGVVGVMALGANVASVVLLMKYREGDANVRSVWLCSRNDAIGNIAVVLAAGAVAATASAWPDIVVALAMALLFLRSAAAILTQAFAEMREGRRQLPAE